MNDAPLWEFEAEQLGDEQGVAGHGVMAGGVILRVSAQQGLVHGF